MDDGLDAPFAAALADRYTIERELGHGGMATVYLARDLRHDRPVALKVLRPELAAAMGPERFRREITTAARLHHPHILGVHDSGESAGRLWFTMPYVEGESLRDRLARVGPLPIDEATRIAAEIAEALHSAHRHGVIHRDVKPENILLTEDGQALLADFGIARPLEAGGSEGARPSGPAAITGTGFSVGTPAYMSPEQAAADPNVDARSDVYGLGSVLYEMLSGEPPFTGPSPAAVIARRFSEPARPLRTVRPGVPPALEATTLRALERAPSDRFASAGELARALRTTASTPSGDAVARPPRRRMSRLTVAGFATVALVVIVVGVGFWRRSRLESPGGAGADQVTRLAVLPFEHLGRPDDAYITDGLTDEIRGKLSSVASVQVIARASSNEYRKTAKSPRSIASELGVRYLLTGTVRTEPATSGHAARLRVSPELVEVASDGAPITRWQHSFDTEIADVFEMQAAIAGQVAGAMNVALEGDARAHLAAAPTRNPAAYDAFLRGEAASNGIATREPTTLRRALEHYTSAVTLDSGFALAWAQRSRTASLLYFNGVPTPAMAGIAKTSAERAIALAPDLPGAHLALGDYYGGVVRDFPRALSAYEKGRRLSPNDAELISSIAALEQSIGRMHESLRDMRLAASLDPRSSVAFRRLGHDLLWARRLDEARVALDRSLALTPTNAITLELRAAADLADGNLDAARRVVAGADEIDRETLIVTFGNYWDLYWVLEDADQRRLLTLPPAAYDGDTATWAWVRSQTYALRGDASQARAYADSTVRHVETQLRENPTDAQRTLFRGFALVVSGRTDEGVRAAERGAALMPLSRDAYQGAYLLHQLARVYVAAGQQDRAVDALERLLRIPYYLSPAWLRIDPQLAALRTNARFARLTATEPVRF